jgi:glutathione synthase
MRFLFLVNDVNAIAPSQTTAMLIAAAARGYSVWVTDVTALSCANHGLPQAYAKNLKVRSEDTLPTLMAQLAHLPWETVPLDRSAIDILFIRTNPARDLARSAAHQTAIAFTRLAQDRGVQVINRPDGLIRAATKLYLLELPAFVRPATLVSQNRAEIVAFIEKLQGPAVVKPLQGTRGSDVFFVASHADKNLNQMLDVILRQGLAMVQSCIPNAEAGDTRVVVLNGQILEIDGQPGAIHRVPSQGDFRSNLHTGGMAKPGVISAEMRQVAAAIGEKLVGDGLLLVGLDFMGGQLLEINVFSTGGLRDAERFTGKAFAEHIIQTFALSASDCGN